MNIVFAGTPNFAAEILKGLLQSKVNIIACFSQPDKPFGRGRKLSKTPVKTVAEEFNIPVFQPKNFNSKPSREQLRSLNPDLMIVVAYGLLLLESVLDIPTHGCINVHGSILPKYRGASPVQHTILNGEVETGITIFQIDKGLDSGDILGVYNCPLTSTDTTKTLLEKFIPISIDALRDIIKKFETNKITKAKQDHAGATFAPKINKTDALINWNEDNAITIDRKIRAYYPWPIAYFAINVDKEIEVEVEVDAGASASTQQNNYKSLKEDKNSKQNENENLQNKNITNIKVIEADVIDAANMEKIVATNKAASNNDAKNFKPGTIIQMDKNGLIIAAKTGTISLTKLQFPGSKVLNIQDVLNSPKYKSILSALHYT